MHYSSIFVYCFIGVVNLSLSGANPARNAVLPLNCNDLPSTNGNNKIINIQNGVTSLDQPDTLHISAPTANVYQTGPTRAGTNIQEEEDSNFKTFNSAGTSFVHNTNNRMGLFNIGYGSGNHNEVVISVIPAQTENTGSQPSTSGVMETYLKNLHSTNEQLEQIVTQLIQLLNPNKPF